jgi:hypothetical protein
VGSVASGPRVGGRRRGSGCARAQERRRGRGRRGRARGHLARGEVEQCADGPRVAHIVGVTADPARCTGCAAWPPPSPWKGRDFRLMEGGRGRPPDRCALEIPYVRGLRLASGIPESSRSGLSGSVFVFRGFPGPEGEKRLFGQAERSIQGKCAKKMTCGMKDFFFKRAFFPLVQLQDYVLFAQMQSRKHMFFFIESFCLLLQIYKLYPAHSCSPTSPTNTPTQRNSNERR